MSVAAKRIKTGNGKTGRPISFELSLVVGEAALFGAFDSCGGCR
jgi:hypothetical protein